MLDFKNSEFKFADNDSVYIDSESAKKFFNGSTAFKYEFTEKNLVLTENSTKIEIPYSVSKDFRNVDLEINFSGIKKIGLIRMNK